MKAHFFNTSNARHTNVVKLLGEPWVKDSKWNIPLEFIFGEDLEMTIFKVQLSKIQVKMSTAAQKLKICHPVLTLLSNLYDLFL